MRFNRLDLNLLVALDALLTEQSITKAAARLNLSPSATSNALARLRDYFDDELLVQVGRRMELTPRAQGLQDPIRDLLVRAESVVAIQPRFEPASSDRVFRIFVSDYTQMVLVPHLLALAAAEGCTARFEFLPQVSNPQRSLERGEADMLLMPRDFLSPDHPHAILYVEEFICVMWQDSALARGELSFERYLAAGHVVMQPPDHRRRVLRGLVRQALRGDAAGGRHQLRLQRPAGDGGRDSVHRHGAPAAGPSAPAQRGRSRCARRRCRSRRWSRPCSGTSTATRIRAWSRSLRYSDRSLMPSLRASSARLPRWALSCACKAARSTLRSDASSGARQLQRCVPAAAAQAAARGRAGDAGVGAQRALHMHGLDLVPSASSARAPARCAARARCPGRVLLQQRQRPADSDSRRCGRHACQQGHGQQRDVVGRSRSAGRRSGRCSAGSTGLRGSGRRPPWPSGRGAWPTPRARRCAAARCCPRGGRCRFPAGAAA
jgi:DNA-binding transcriptional LysR family regulator